MPTELDELKYDMVYALSDAAPEGWQRIDLTCQVNGDAHEFAVTVLTADFEEAVMEVPAAVVPLVPRLRELRQAEGMGAWRSLRFTIDPPTRFRFAYHLDRDPEEARGSLDAGQQERLWSLVANLVLLNAPIDWDHVELDYRAAGDHVELTGRVRRLSDGGYYLWEPPNGIRGLMARLRAGVYRPGRGTWFGVTAHVGLDTAIDYEYGWDREPLWDRLPRASAFAADLDRFPRDAAHVPVWLAERLGPLGVATMTGSVEDALRAAEDAAAELELDPDRYRIGAVADGAWCLVPEDGRWAVFLAHAHGDRTEEAVFDTARAAVRHFVGHLYLHRAAFRDELPPDAKRPTEDWPIQPMGDDIALTLYGGKRIVTLPPGTEGDRYGDPSGNTLFAARTEFTHRSHPAEDERREYHVYRLTRPVRAITGTTIPWYDQEGGGTAYILERSVADLLANGSLVELEKATTMPPRRG